MFSTAGATGASSIPELVAIGGRAITLISWATLDELKFYCQLLRKHYKI